MSKVADFVLILHVFAPIMSKVADFVLILHVFAPIMSKVVDLGMTLHIFAQIMSKLADFVLILHTFAQIMSKLCIFIITLLTTRTKNEQDSKFHIIPDHMTRICTHQSIKIVIDASQHTSVYFFLSIYVIIFLKDI